jgi:hypothetical protein
MPIVVIFMADVPILLGGLQHTLSKADMLAVENAILIHLGMPK